MKHNSNAKSLVKFLQDKVPFFWGLSSLCLATTFACSSFRTHKRYKQLHDNPISHITDYINDSLDSPEYKTRIFAQKVHPLRYIFFFMTPVVFRPKDKEVYLVYKKGLLFKSVNCLNDLQLDKNYHINQQFIDQIDDYIRNIAGDQRYIIDYVLICEGSISSVVVHLSISSHAKHEKNHHRL